MRDNLDFKEKTELLVSCCTTATASLLDTLAHIKPDNYQSINSYVEAVERLVKLTTQAQLLIEIYGTGEIPQEEETVIGIQVDDSDFIESFDKFLKEYLANLAE